MKIKNISKKITLITCGLVLASAVLTSCDKYETPFVPPVVTPANPRPNTVFLGLTDNNHILRYNATTVESPSGDLTITGLASGERLLSIDFRPATGQLYALGSTSRLYIINLNSGVATQVGTTQFTPNLNGSTANIDFNPTVDRVRLVTNTGQNLRLNPETGGVAAVDGSIIATANISSIAYNNNVSGATLTTLYDIDVTTQKLFKQDPPNNGTLVEVGNLGVTFSGKGGFDINPDNSVALATLAVGGVNTLYTINLSTGAATNLGNITANLVDIAIPTNAVAYAISAVDGAFQTFNPLVSNSVISKAVTGLATGETILGIDFRPINGQLYGIAATAAGAAKMYTFNLSSGLAVAVGTGFAITPGTTSAGVDFNPTVDRIRLVTNLGQNFRLNPNDGTIAATDLAINPATVTTGAAYTNNFPSPAGATPAPTTVLYVLDSTKLYIQNPPNNGTLTAVGTGLGINKNVEDGFDIGGASNTAYGVFTVGTTTNVYTINLTTGVATAGVSYSNRVKGMAVGLGF